MTESAGFGHRRGVVTRGPHSPFVLIDDAAAPSATARLFTGLARSWSAHHANDVYSLPDFVSTARADGLHVQGYLAYEAGLGLEPALRKVSREVRRAGVPLGWFGAFQCRQDMSAAATEAWLPTPRV